MAAKDNSCYLLQRYFRSLGGATVTVMNRNYEANNNKQLSGYLDFVNLLNCNHYEFVCCTKKDNLTIFSETFPFSLADHFTKHLPKSCPDSNIASTLLEVEQNLHKSSSLASVSHSP